MFKLLFTFRWDIFGEEDIRNGLSNTFKKNKRKTQAVATPLKHYSIVEYGSSLLYKVDLPLSDLENRTSIVLQRSTGSLDKIEMRSSLYCNDDPLQNI